MAALRPFYTQIGQILSLEQLDAHFRLAFMVYYL